MPKLSFPDYIHQRCFRFSNKVLIKPSCILLATNSILPTAAQELSLTSANNSSGVWALVIGIVVVATTLASAALCVAAYRNWEQKLWRLSALLPLGILGLLLITVVYARIISDSGHYLWPLELFAWSMGNMIYMVSLMTIKRIFAKADAGEEQALPDSQS